MAKKKKDDKTLQYGIKTMRKQRAIAPPETDDHELRVALHAKRLTEKPFEASARRFDDCGDEKWCKAKPRKVNPNLSPAGMDFGYTSPSVLREDWDKLQAKKKVAKRDCPSGKAGNACRAKVRAHNARLQKKINALKAKGGGGTKPCAEILTKQRCPVQLIFTQGKPQLRFCTASNKKGRVISFASRAEAAKEANRICACWRKNKGKNWDKKCGIGTAPLGSTRKRRRG